MYTVNVCGPHHSGNRLVKRVLAASPDLHVEGRSLPTEGTWFDVGASLWVVMVRDHAVDSVVRHQTHGVPTFEVAELQWFDAYEQLHEELGGQWWLRPDVMLLWYSRLVRIGGCVDFIERVAKHFNILPWDFAEGIYNGDVYYNYVEPVQGP